MNDIWTKDILIRDKQVKAVLFALLLINRSKGSSFLISPSNWVMRKPIIRVSDQVRNKPGCTTTEDGILGSKRDCENREADQLGFVNCLQHLEILSEIRVSDARKAAASWDIEASNKQLLKDKLSLVVRKPTFWFLTCTDTIQAVQLQKMARGLKFQI